MKIMAKGRYLRQHWVITITTDSISGKEVVNLLPTEGVPEANTLMFELESQGFQRFNHFVGGSFSSKYEKQIRTALTPIEGVFVGEKIWIAPASLKETIASALKSAGARVGISLMENSLGESTGLWPYNRPFTPEGFEFGQKD